jgi:uncharacterized lipoprotein YajG
MSRNVYEEASMNKVLMMTAATALLWACSSPSGTVLSSDAAACRSIASVHSDTGGAIWEPSARSTFDSCMSARGYAPNSVPY